MTDLLERPAPRMTAEASEGYDKSPLIFAIGGVGCSDVVERFINHDNVHVVHHHEPSEPEALAEKIIERINRLKRTTTKKAKRNVVMIPVTPGREPDMIVDPLSIDWPVEYIPDLTKPTDPLLPFLDGAVDINDGTNWNEQSLLARYPIGAVASADEVSVFARHPRPLQRYEAQIPATELMPVGAYRCTQTLATNAIVLSAGTPYGTMHYSVGDRHRDGLQPIHRQPDPFGMQWESVVSQLWSPRAGRLYVSTHPEPDTYHAFTL